MVHSEEFVPTGWLYTNCFFLEALYSAGFLGVELDYFYVAVSSNRNSQCHYLSVLETGH